MAESWRRRELGLGTSSGEEEDEMPLQRHSKKLDPPSPVPEKRRPVRKVYEKKKKAMLAARVNLMTAEHSAFRSQGPSLTIVPASAPQVAKSTPPQKVPPSSPVFATYNRNIGKRKRGEESKFSAATATSRENLIPHEEFSKIIQQAKRQATLIAREHEAKSIAAAALQEEAAERARVEEERKKREEEIEAKKKQEEELRKRRLAPTEPAQAPPDLPSDSSDAPALRAQDLTGTLAEGQFSKPASPVQAFLPQDPIEEDQHEERIQEQEEEPLNRVDDDGIIREEEARQSPSVQLQRKRKDRH